MKTYVLIIDDSHFDEIFNEKLPTRDLNSDFDKELSIIIDSDERSNFNERFTDSSNTHNDGSEIVKIKLIVETIARVTEEEENIIINDNRKNEQQSGKDFFLFIL